MSSTSRSGRPIHFTVSGDGPPIVLLHGVFQAGDHWDKVGYTPTLEQRFTVIAIDSLGHGRSAAPEEQDAYALARRTDDVVAVLDEVGADQAGIWGYSMGGWQALGVAKFAPTRASSLIVGGWDPIVGLPTAYAYYSEVLGLPSDTDWFGGLYAMSQSDPIIGPTIAAGNEAVFRRNHRACELEAEGLNGALRYVGGPVLLYCGDQDPYHDNMKTAAHAAGASFETITEADHGGAWNKSSAVLSALDTFLDKLG